MRINDGVAVAMKNIAERKQFERSRLSCPRLADDVDMSRTVVRSMPNWWLIPRKLVTPNAEIFSSMASLPVITGSLAGGSAVFDTCPDNIWCLDIGVGQMKD